MGHHTHLSHSPTKVCSETLISSRCNHGQREVTESARPNQGHQVPSKKEKYHKDDIQADLLIQGHFNRGEDLLVDFLINDLDAKYQVRTDQEKLLVAHEKKKKVKYLDLCLIKPCHFNPFVISTDYMMEREATPLVISLDLKLAW